MQQSNNRTLTDKLKALGPGLLFAGAAIGVSHLVQSTKAGAEYGFALLWVIVVANLLKYPFFEFGPRYTAATGENLLRGYQRLGNWVLGIFAVMTIGTMFTVIAAVTIVTAGLATSITGIGTVLIWSAGILAICLALLGVGKYALLDKMMKVVIIVLTISTVVAVGFAIGNPTSELSMVQSFPWDATGFTFLIALIGWMPAPIDLSVWHSMWAIEKSKQKGQELNLKSSLFDFNIGYIGTTILAACFLSLGALVMHGSGEEFSPKAGVFAGQLLALYTKNLGESAAWVIALAAFTTMFSTTLTCLDAFPRVMAKTTNLFTKDSKNENTLYWIWMALLVVGALGVLNFFLASMGKMVLVATVLSFLTAPFFAIANYALVTSKHMPEEARPPLWLKVLSGLGMAFLLIFGVLFLLNFMEWLF